MTKKVVLCCEKCGSRNYTVPVSNQAQAVRLERKKFCSHCQTHTLHKQSI
ncbi:50S ribosomal protein L33 [Paenisporosarcina cavernae]|uniref:Large ribosomal subunit protein bL33 n=1 Tax=Paenisporosarcina cavernae TaxID=2320858 RepID=A0A385YWH4_9BACL|nr:50S ribosomal protein L33 [Paenisporosarcina cavernae]AYC30630.1 50S ribosomal protein L33 [Paenisporosarcina cavernae]